MDEVALEKVIIYGSVAFLILVVLLIYYLKMKRENRVVREKIRISKEEGLHEPVSLHPVVNPNSCIKTGACVMACPEKDILGILDGRATTINASRCIGHGACFHACPVEAISLCIGTEKRGVDLPHVNQNFETNVPGIYIAGELGGMGLIKNAVEQGKQAVENLSKKIHSHPQTDYDLVIVGAGPAGISATLMAKKLKLRALTVEQDTLGGAVFTFPRRKIVMTSPMDLPLHGKVKLFETKKITLLELWQQVLAENRLQVQENTKIESIENHHDHFIVGTSSGQKISSKKVLLAIGRRGTPRKLNIPGEESEKVAYRLIEPELYKGRKVVVVGGGDSAIESALLLADENKVTLSYRGDSFPRIKPINNQKITAAYNSGKIDILWKSNLVKIDSETVDIIMGDSQEPKTIENDHVFISVGGELPLQFLEKIGIHITRKFGEAILKH